MRFKLKINIETIEHNSELAVFWFKMNYMKLNTDKCHVLVPENKNGQMWARLDRNIVCESNDVKYVSNIVQKLTKNKGS